MPIFDLKQAVFISLMALAGCGGLPKLPSLPFLDGAEPAEIRGAITLDSGLKVQGPFGYCVTGDSPRSRRGTSMVTLASCVILREEDAFDPTDGRLLTVSVSELAAQKLPSLRSYLESDAGRDALSAGGDGSTVTIHRIEKSRVAIYVDYTDTSRPEKLGQRSWKGFLNLNDALIILGVNAGVGLSVEGDIGEGLMRDLAAELLRVN